MRSLEAELAFFNRARAARPVAGTPAPPLVPQVSGGGRPPSDFRPAQPLGSSGRKTTICYIEPILSIILAMRSLLPIDGDFALRHTADILAIVGKRND